MATNTNGSLTITSQWRQTSTDDNNAQNTVTDAGQLSYQKQYASGTTSGTVNQIYNSVGSLSSGGALNFNLMALSQNILGNSFTKTFTGINSITIENRSTRPDYNFTINVSSSSGFKEPYGYPTGVITMGPNSCVHVNVSHRDWPVSTGARQILFTDGGSGAAYSMSIMGHN